MDFLKIKYKDKEYLIEEIIQESNDFLKELVLPVKFRIDSSFTDFGLINDKGYAIACEKYRDLYSVLSNASFALFNAHMKLHNDHSLWKSGYTGTLWLRSQYLQNSILWYNSCEEYVLQIIWFAFDFFKDLKKYSQEMSNCGYKKILKELANYKDLENTSIIIKELHSFHENENVAFVRKLANLMKHKQLINFNGLGSNRLMTFNSNDFSSSLIEKECVDIDEVIVIIKNVHILAVEFGSFLFDFINFKEMFVYNEKGNIILGEKREKKEYKKLIINEKYAT